MKSSKRTNSEIPDAEEMDFEDWFEPSDGKKGDYLWKWHKSNGEQHLSPHDSEAEGMEDIFGIKPTIISYEQ